MEIKAGEIKVGPMDPEELEGLMAAYNIGFPTLGAAVEVHRDTLYKWAKGKRGDGTIPEDVAKRIRLYFAELAEAADAAHQAALIP